MLKNQKSKRQKNYYSLKKTKKTVEYLSAEAKNRFLELKRCGVKY